MTDNNQSPETAQNVTELKPKRKLDYKKYAKYAAYGTTAVLSAIVIFKLASTPEAPQPVEFDEQTPEADQNVI